MNLKSYLNLYALLKSSNSTRSQRREFGLSHSNLKEKPEEQLLKWTDKFKHQLPKPLLSEVLSSYLYGITLTLVVISFCIGLFSGIGLLSYNGNEPVNVIYFMAMVIFLPIFTIILTLISMFRVKSTQSMLIHISPAFWMERVLAFLPNKMDKYLKTTILELKLNPLIVNWIVIKRSQILALTFSLGLLFSLLAIIATKDIAFAWSTTLNISPENFYNFLYSLSFVWRDIFPWAVPSLELVEHSQYYRLGERLNEEMINNASLLGEWWKFLLFATIFYAIILRLIMVVMSSVALNRAIKVSFLTLDGSQKLLNDMNEPIISTAALVDEVNFLAKNVEYARVVKNYEASYDNILGWALDKTVLVLINDNMCVESKNLYEVGGSQTLIQDNEVVKKCYGNILLYVKAWEPPTMDFIDFLEILLENTDKITVTPIGTHKKQYVTSEKELNIWAKKLYTLNSEKVWVKI